VAEPEAVKDGEPVTEAGKVTDERVKPDSVADNDGKGDEESVRDVVEVMVQVSVWGERVQLVGVSVTVDSVNPECVPEVGVGRLPLREADLVRLAVPVGIGVAVLVSVVVTDSMSVQLCEGVGLKDLEGGKVAVDGVWTRVEGVRVRVYVKVSLAPSVWVEPVPDTAVGVLVLGVSDTVTVPRLGVAVTDASSVTVEPVPVGVRERRVNVSTGLRVSVGVSDTDISVEIVAVREWGLGVGEGVSLDDCGGLGVLVRLNEVVKVAVKVAAPVTLEVGVGVSVVRENDTLGETERVGLNDTLAGNEGVSVSEEDHVGVGVALSGVAVKERVGTGVDVAVGDMVPVRVRVTDPRPLADVVAVTGEGDGEGVPVGVNEEEASGEAVSDRDLGVGVSDVKVSVTDTVRGVQVGVKVSESRNVMVEPVGVAVSDGGRVAVSVRLPVGEGVNEKEACGE